MSLRRSLYEALAQAPHVKIISPPPDSPLASQLLCFTVPDRDRDQQLLRRLTEDKILARGSGGIYKLGIHLCVCDVHIERFVNSLRKGLA